jgi:oligoribonuclease
MKMTGLDPDIDAIIEIFCLITDGQLNLLDEAGWSAVVHQSSETMAKMDEWCTRVRKHLPCHFSKRSRWIEG